MNDTTRDPIVIIDAPRPEDDGLPLETPPAVASENAHQVQIFNPLDAEPVQFQRQLVARSENFDALANHLRGILVVGKDFGRIHIAKRGKDRGECENPWDCTYQQNPRHWSDYRLLKPGADKIVGLLGLGVTYPDEEDYRRAALKGIYIEDVIIKAYIDNGRGQTISEGMGAAGRKKHKGDLNNTIKKACKRARLDAVERLPSISAVFEEDFLAEIAKQENSLNKRQRRVDPKHDTGAALQVWPLKGKLTGQRFSEMDDGAIDWILQNFQNKPDIHQAAQRVREARDANTETHPADAAPATAKAENDYSDYPEAQ